MAARWLMVTVLGSFLALSGCESLPGPGEPTRSPDYDSGRDVVFDALVRSIDAYYDLEDVDRRQGRVTSRWNYDSAAAVFSLTGYRTRAFGKVVRGEKSATGLERWGVEVKVQQEINTDKDNPANPYQGRWRREGVNPTLQAHIIEHLNTYLLDYGPSEDLLRRMEEERESREPR